MRNHDKAGVPFWATLVLVVVVVAYPLSFGPACWACDRDVLSDATVDLVYSPLAEFCLSVGIGNAACWYGALLPPPQPYLSTSGFGHSNWRTPKVHALLWARMWKRWERQQSP